MLQKMPSTTTSTVSIHRMNRLLTRFHANGSFPVTSESVVASIPECVPGCCSA